MRKSLSFSDCPTKCRPIIVSSEAKAQQAYFVPIPYNYELKDIKEMEAYLCPSIKIIGVDFEESPSPIPKLKYRHTFIGGKNVEKNELEVKEGSFQKLDWNVDVAVPLPPTTKPAGQQIKLFLVHNLSLWVSQMPHNTDTISVDLLKKSKVQCFSSNRKLSKGSKKQSVLINCIPVSLLVPKKGLYSTKQVIELIAGDLVKSINIMRQSEMLIRIVGRHEGLLPVQTFLKNQGEQDSIFDKLINKKVKQSVELQSGAGSGQTGEKNNGNMLKMLLLVVALVAIIGFYVAFKFL